MALVIEEMQRLLGHPTSAQSTLLTPFNYRISSRDFRATDHRIKEVLLAVDRALLGDDRADSLSWGTVLPVWFVREFREEWSPDGAERERERLQNLSYEEKLREAQENRGWTLSGWIDWMLPERRVWYWLSSSGIDLSCGYVAIGFLDLPPATGALFWLFSASGATEIVEA